MKTREEIEEILRKHKPYLQKKFKVKEIGIFGSYARDQQKKESDIDLLVELEEPIGWEFIDLKEFLGKKLGNRIDLVTVKALKPQLKNKILEEVIYA
ncbi:MAG: nucleotidyltransferase [Candidatus Altiarchaeales archaeon ex4484_2]|nr:MAG: nucleotidyltransferase [Candidatus Altiarchaeales archaeon ex4484_2]